MKKSYIKLPIIFCTLIMYGSIKAQQEGDYLWQPIITLHYEYSFGTNDWEYSHPLYTGSGVHSISETGTFKTKSIFSVGFEISKGYYGFNVNTGIIPAEINVDKTGMNYNFNSFFLEIEGIFFPLSNPADKLVPLLKIGGGGIKSSGDLTNSALFYSFSGGIRTSLSEKTGVTLMIKGRHITYNEIPLNENVTGDISFTNFAIKIEALYKL